MFQKATKLKLRFNTPKGQLSTEDLWDLPLTSVRNISLDGLAIAINQELKASEQESFVEARTRGNEILSLKLDILKAVIADKQADNASKLQRQEKLAQREKILKALADKKDEALTSLTEAELEEMLKSA